MSEAINDTILKIFILVYNFLLVAGTAYLVQAYDWSMWTFLLAMFFFITTSKSNEVPS